MTAIEIAALVVSLVVAVVLHETSHATVAFWLGDDTAKRAGRMSLNPVRHVDPFGTLLLPGALILISLVTGGPPFVFGYAKPVPVDRSKLRSRRLGSLAVSLAGPLTNLVLAMVAILALAVMTPGAGFDAVRFAIAFLLLNVTLFVFNILPVPPLDGSELIAVLLPERARRSFAAVGPIAFVILLVVVFQFSFLERAVNAIATSLIEWFVT